MITTYQLSCRVRRDVLETAHVTKSAHIGSALSIVDILAVLFNDVMTVFPDDTDNPKRDRFILSKGHGSMALYAILAEKGFFSREELLTQGANGSRLSSHVSHKVPGVELSTGSLGMGLSIATGMAIAAVRKKGKHRIYTVLGDGECAEGSVWEAAMLAGHNKLSNLTVIIDHNKLQANDTCDNVINWNRIADQWRSFGWHTIECNGHDISALESTLRFIHGTKPVCIVAHTTKGKGISFMENEKIWHHLSPQGEDYLTAVRELEVYL